MTKVIIIPVSLTVAFSSLSSFKLKKINKLSKKMRKNLKKILLMGETERDLFISSFAKKSKITETQAWGVFASIIVVGDW
ncbi:hypothetical protein ACFLY7_00395 [Patescibacteria group bacterium]